MKYQVCKALLCGVISLQGLTGAVLAQQAAVADETHVTGGGRVTGEAHITEEVRSLLTYPYSDPNPVPALNDTRKAKIYPYHGFDGYSEHGRMQDWKVVKLENDYIEVYVLPEAGGKVWGAVEKSTGKEFIYMNKVIKFRNVALRGPWTSGGIEFNFGIIGHTPATAAPVDYLTRRNEDGSVSCVVGTIDLPSRTQWRVEIRLPSDKAWFETRVLWYNPTPLRQPYYNWMTGAARVSDDLQFFYPGTVEFGHSGEAGSWPVDSSGRDLSWYANNDFGSHKSYHVAGSYAGFMGGYYHDSGFGFGHWARHNDMPGKKLWLWALSRNGGIWEDLLTDTDGQYMEFQAGRLYNQYSPSSLKTPITEAGFQPGATDTWSELWFPVKGIGGMSAVSPLGVLNVTESDDTLHIAVNALASVKTPLVVRAGGDTLFSGDLAFRPMEVYETEVVMSTKAKDLVEVRLENMDLLYRSAGPPELQRPVRSESTERTYSTPSQLYHQGMDLMEARDYNEAKEYFRRCIEKDPAHLDALAALAGLSYRSGRYDSTLYYANRALREDTYHPGANFQAGNAYRAQKDLVNAMDAFGWAARSMTYRSEAYSQMAGISLQAGRPEDAVHYARQSLDYNRYHINSLQILTLAYRLLGQGGEAGRVLKELLEADPLNHFAQYEQSLRGGSSGALQDFTSFIRNEFPWQSYLELALFYLHQGGTGEALRLLEQSPSHPLVSLWKAYLSGDSDGPAGNPGALSGNSAGLAGDVRKPAGDTRKPASDIGKPAGDTGMLAGIAAESPDFVFPYRRETAKALEWAASKNPHWKFKYYLALNYQTLGRKEEAISLMKSCEEAPDYAPFYLARASLLNGPNGRKRDDLEKAVQLAPGDWRTRMSLLQYYDSEGDHRKALDLASRAWNDFQGDYTIGLEYARQLLLNDRPEESLKILEGITVLPYEGASRGREVYEQSLLMHSLNLMAARRYPAAVKALEQSREWPEHLGVGKPYKPDERFQDYLTGICMERQGKKTDAMQFYEQAAVSTLERAAAYAPGHRDRPDFRDLSGLLALRKLGREEEARKLLQGLRPSGISRALTALFNSEPGAAGSEASGSGTSGAGASNPDATGFEAFADNVDYRLVRWAVALQ